jgi:plasmid stabilization system protein ParE
MAKKKIDIVWSKSAAKDFEGILDYLYHESQDVANLVGNKILDVIEDLLNHYLAYPLDKYKLNNDGNYRACLVYSYRISFYIAAKSILILRIRHTSREPLDF